MWLNLALILNLALRTLSVILVSFFPLLLLFCFVAAAVFVVILAVASVLLLMMLLVLLTLFFYSFIFLTAKRQMAHTTRINGKLSV